MQIGICSYSFHRLLAAAKQDIFRYITDCRDLGCTQLDPWNNHLPELKAGDEAVQSADDAGLSEAEEAYVLRVRQAADEAGMPFGNIALDGAHIYDADPAKMRANRGRRYRWLNIAEKLGARQIRIDAGGPENMPADVFGKIVSGYRDIIDLARPRGIEIVVENHWGPTLLPDNVIRLLKGIEGLGYLFDTFNWRPDKKADGRRRCARYATACHIKPLEWDANGNEVGEDIAGAIDLLQLAGYSGAWGIESTPKDGDEYGAAKKSIALLKKLVG